MERIEKVWFADNRIYIRTKDGSEKSRPLEAFPRLMDATDEERLNFEVWADDQSIRWDCIDEDIHISSFNDISEPDPNSEVAKMFESVGVIDICAFANMIGMRKSKLDLFRYGIWSPSSETLQKIKEGFRQIENRISAFL